MGDSYHREKKTTPEYVHHFLYQHVVASVKKKVPRVREQLFDEHVVASVEKKVPRVVFKFNGKL